MELDSSNRCTRRMLLVCDKQGRILIPKYLKDYAAIKRDVMIIGVSNRIAVWAKDAWLEYYNSSKESFEEIAEKMMTEES